MKVIQKGKEETYHDLYPDEYEFKLCGGSIQPKDRIIHPKGEKDVTDERGGQDDRNRQD